ncbi:MAG: CapA family protein [Erysipelotrichia bacterium]|nr:CapA family protein [Erysipelotrichia bacterium]
MKKWLVLLCCLLLSACSATTSDKDSESKEVKHVESKEDEIINASFLAVGDNLIHGAIYYYNQKADGSYFFNDIYEHTNEYTSSADLAYINFETICAGTELGLSSYPTFNGPTEVIDAVHSAGFDWLSGASNHTFDRGEAGILTELNYIRNNFPDMSITGIHDSKEDAQKSVVLDVNGLKVGVLDYTYGLNGFTLPENKEYLVDLIDKDKMKSDMAKLTKVSDIQMVSMHWGEEYQFVPNATQQELAQYLSDLGVDVIIGTHPHVIQPMDYITGKEGNETLVMYSLGNFLSAQDVNYRMLGGMATWCIEYNKTKDKLVFKEVKFLPTITQIEGDYSFYRTYALKDWNDELATRHTLRVKEGQEVSRQYYINLVNQVMNDKIEIVY